MKILLLAHSSHNGGAETALKNLVEILLKNQHTVEILFTAKKGAAIDYFLSRGIPCLEYLMGWSIPDVPSAFHRYASADFNIITSILKDRGYHLIITNTIVMLHGGIIANKLNIPHIYYVLEDLLSDEDLAPLAMSPKRYLQLVESQSDYLICASKFVKTLFQYPERTSILYPYIFPDKPLDKENYAKDSEFNLMVIGISSLRKNVHFSVTVLKALRLRMKKISLHIIGSNGTGFATLQNHIRSRNEPNLHIHPPTPDPYALLAGSKRITLVCSKTEPLGLTIIESLQRGIPVVASRSGGPNEVLMDECLYDVDDVGGCVRAIENILNDYDLASADAISLFKTISKEHSLQNQMTSVETAIQGAVLNYSMRKTSTQDMLWDSYRNFSNINKVNFSIQELAKQISIASEDSPQKLTEEAVLQLIEHEKKLEGLAAISDMLRYDAIPFSDSKQWLDLHQNGLGIAIASAARLDQEASKKMSAFILLSLQEEQPKDLRVLMIGDWLAIDSIILSCCGFQVDYLDESKSMSGRVAQLNCKKLKANVHFIDKICKQYDAIVCLAGIEHEVDVFRFLTKLSNATKPRGLLLISENFAGINDRTPSHLYQNEKLSDKLPFICSPYYDLVSTNKNALDSRPPGKPYTFRKKPSTSISPEQIFRSITIQ